MLKSRPNNPSPTLGAGRGRRASLWSIVVTLGLLCALAGALLAVCQPAAAQAQSTTTLADFDAAGLDVDMAAVIRAGSDSVWWFPASSLGTLVEGELGIGPDNVIPISIASSSTGSTITIQHSDNSFSFATHFGGGGDGAEDYLFLQMGGTAVNWRIADQTAALTATSLRMNVPTVDRTFVRGIDREDTVLIAIATPNTPSLSPDPETLDSHVNTNQTFEVSDTLGVQNVDVIVTNDTGNMTLHSTENGLSCSNPVTELSLASGSTFWVRYCETGRISIRVQEAGAATNGTSYTVDIGTPPVPLSITDLDATGLSADVAALIEAEGTDIVYAAGSYTAAGTLVSGHLNLGPGTASPITRFRFRSGDSDSIGGAGGDVITINDGSGSVELGEYFEPGGDGSDLSFYIQTTADNVASWSVASSFGRGGSSYVHFEVPSAHRSMVAGIGAGDRFIFALARSSEPYFDSDTATRAVDENALINTEVGDPVTATDPEEATLTYSISGDSAFSINNSTGQILTTVSDLDYETATSHVVMVTATSSGGSDTITVTININDLDDGLRLSPDPASQHWHVDTNQQFSGGNTPGVMSVTISETAQTGDLTLRTTESGLSCSSQENEITIASDAHFWVRFCDTGTVTLRMEDVDDSTNHREWTVTITEDSATEPHRVTGLTADPGDEYIDLAWDAPDDGGSPITSYDYSSDSGITWRSTGSTDTTYHATQTSFPVPVDLHNGNIYLWMVRAVNAIGAGPASTFVSAAPRDPTEPDAPTGLSAVAGDGQVTLSWEEPDDNDSAITGYEFTRNGGSDWHSTGTGTSLTTVDTLPVNGFEYDYQVRAVNSVGAGPGSNTVQATPEGPPTAPSGLETSVGDGTVTLSWTAPSNNGGQAITSYEYRVDSGSWTSTGSTSLSHEVTGLTNAQEYTFRVRARNTHGAGAASGSTDATPTPFTTPSAPPNLTLTPGNEFVDLDWSAPTDNGGTPITGYEWTTAHPFGGFHAADGWEDTGSLETNFRATRRTNNAETPFVNGTEECFGVRAVNSEGFGSTTSTLCATPANQPPAFGANTVDRAVDENLLVGANVGPAVTASDPEGDTVVYSITGANPGGFTVLDTAGQIQTGQILNHEALASYAITLTATATGGSDTIAVMIAVNDVNEAPVFGQDSYARSVNENVSTGTDLGSPITADDVDGDTLTYTLAGSSAFAVNASGQVETAGTINYEAASSYTLTLTASDGTLSDTATVNVTVNNLPEDATLTGLDVPSATITRTTARLEATLDNQDSTLTTVHLRFRTPPGSGPWTSAGSDSTAGSSLEVELTNLTPGAEYRVQASLSSSFPSSGRQQADFTLASNSAPDFGATAVTRRIDENSLAGHLVGEPVTATDADSDTLAYTLGGTDVASFDLDAATGQLTVGTGTVLDYETKPSYSVTVTATDTHGDTGVVTVAIEVRDIREAGLLGRIVITVGSSGALYGYDSGAYGSLDSGEWPGALFGDGNSRAVDAIYENADGEWFFTYSGGAADDWLADQEQLDEVLLDVAYEDDRDGRTFVLGGFVADRPGSRGLKLAPPLSSRDWAGRDGEDVALTFRRQVPQLPTIALTRVDAPVVAAGSYVEWLIETTPGGPVVIQYLLVLFVYGIWMLKKRHTLYSFLFGGVVLVLTPWVTVIWGIGTPMAATINAVNIGLGAYVHKYYFDKAEA